MVNINSDVGLNDGELLRDRYRVDGIIGMGGFGITYRAWDITFERQVAVKEYFPAGVATRAAGKTVSVFSSGLTGTMQQGIKRFLQEARDLMRFNENPGIVSVLDFFEENETAYMVMEYLNGCTLKEYMEENQGGIDDAFMIQVIFSLMKVLEEVHAAGLVHRDISPDNIFICSDWTIKLIDFGAARIVSRDMNSSSVVLKHGYAPVEQYVKNGKIGPWTDVYAFGATLYYMMTREKPAESVGRMMEDSLVPPKTLNPSVPDDLNRVIMKALAVRPEDRYRNMGEMRADYLAGEEDWTVPQTVRQNPQGGQVQQGYQNGQAQQGYQNVQVQQDWQSPPDPRQVPSLAGQAPRSDGKKKNRLVLISVAASLLLAVLLVVILILNSGDEGSGRIPSEQQKSATTFTENGNTSTESEPTTDTEEIIRMPEQGNLIRVGVINDPPTESDFREANAKNMENVFSKENGYELKAYYSTQNTEKLKAAREFISEGMEYLLICAAESTGWEEVLKLAKSKGVKVYLFENKLDVSKDLYEATVISDTAMQGETAVYWLLEQKLDSYNVIHIQGALGDEGQVGRSEALNKQFESGTMKKVVQESAGWNAEEAKRIVATAIKSGEEFNVIYAESDSMARGAVEALDEAGISHGIGGDVIIIGFNGYRWALREVLAGKWNYDVQSNPFQAQLISDQIKSGESPAYKILINEDMGFDAATITMEDIDKYGIGE